jgi:hypothetical protein
MDRRQHADLIARVALVLCSGLLLSVPAAAETDCAAIARLKGTVTRMTVHTAWRQLDPNGERSEGVTRGTFSGDGSTVTIADDNPKIGTTVCTFDKKKRLVKAATRSGTNRWGDFDEEVVTYKHVGRTTIEQWTSVQRMGLREPHRAASTTYVTRDADGRLISEAVHYGPELWQRDSTTYTYFADRVEAEIEYGELDAICIDHAVFDLNGNEISRNRSLESTNEYEFDALGNWTKRLKRWSVHAGPLETIETCEITYK